MLYTCTTTDCAAGTNTTLATTNDIGQQPSIAVGDNGNPIIAHYDNTNGDLMLYACTTTDCSTGTNTTLATSGAVGDPIGNVGYNPSIAIGHDGNPIIAHHDYTDSDLEFTRVYMRSGPVVFQ